jgi:ABC-2 type transport system permease protein
MATIARNTQSYARVETRQKSMPFLLQLWMMTKRTLVVNFRVPSAIIPNIIISLFFLLVYNDSLGGASAFFLPGKDYLGFVLPFSIVSAALSGAGLAGQSIVRDIEDGYFDKLLLTPINRWALLLSAMIAGAIVLVIVTVLIVALAIVMGLRPPTGIVGVMGLIGYSLLLGIGFSGLTVGVALLTNSAAATGGASFLFFPLSFLAPTFTPANLLTGWIATAATFNPITYILEATRALMLEEWANIPNEVLLRGFGSCMLLGVVLFGFALFALNLRTKRK